MLFRVMNPGDDEIHTCCRVYSIRLMKIIQVSDTIAAIPLSLLSFKHYWECCYPC